MILNCYKNKDSATFCYKTREGARYEKVGNHCISVLLDNNLIIILSAIILFAKKLISNLEILSIMYLVLTILEK